VAQSFTEFTGNKADNTVSFAYILTVYTNREPRSYHDARGFVINAYQGFLEEQWVEGLRKEYPLRSTNKYLKRCFDHSSITFGFPSV